MMKDNDKKLEVYISPYIEVWGIDLEAQHILASMSVGIEDFEDFEEVDQPIEWGEVEAQS